MKTKKAKVVCIVSVSVILALLLAVNIACAALAKIIDFYLCNSSSSTNEATRLQGAELALQIEQECIVMTKNDDCLPLSQKKKKVNVFGWASTHWVKSGDGSGRVTYIDADLMQALEEYGVETNRDITDRYTYFRSADRDQAGNVLGSLPEEFSRLYEPSIRDTGVFPTKTLDSAKSYSDVALVVLGRVAGESNDLPKTQYKQTEKDGIIQTDDAKTYLDISTEEEELLTYVGANYENVIVIVNSTNTMNLEFMDRIDGLDACLIVGGTGAYGARAIPKILYGEVSPSGRTTDTYAYDFASNPAYVNAGLEGEGAYTNGQSLYPYNIINSNTGKGEQYGRVSYVDYAEGIYVGYKWYETADTEGYFNGVSNQYGNGYEGVVQYPMGYGLSYTDFQWEIVQITPAVGTALAADTTIEIKVRVKNTGTCAGKEVVQLYYEPPYQTGGIEKSSSNLCGMAKTPTLAVGETYDVSLQVKAEDMASYDMNGNGSNVLEAGTYRIKLMKNSHELANVSGNAAVSEYTLAEDIRYTKDGYSGNDVGNKFTGESALDGLSIDGSDSGANITYLTRSDFVGTFPAVKTPDRALSEKAMKLNLIDAEEAKEWIDSSDTAPTMGQKNGLKLTQNNVISELGLALGKDYNDSRWEQLLDQLTLNEMQELTLHATYNTSRLTSVGLSSSKSEDGPAQYGSWGPKLFDRKSTAFPMPTVLAQTWNTALSYSFGLAVGKEAGENKYDGWYGPGINLHRSPFGGRNYEYYSEDGYLSGMMCAQTVRGAKNSGVFCFIKHLSLYNQESMRDGLYTWLTEQTLRETYLKSFKIVIQQGGATGLMSAYNRIGGVWTGGSYALITGVIRQEYGFNGVIITDYSDHHEMMNGDSLVHAGGDLWMDGATNTGRFKYTDWKNSNTFKQGLRSAAKHFIYTWLNALYTNSVYNESADTEAITRELNEVTFSWWIPVLIGIDVLAVCGCGVWLYFVFRKKGKNE